MHNDIVPFTFITSKDVCCLYCGVQEKSKNIPICLEDDLYYVHVCSNCAIMREGISHQTFRNKINRIYKKWGNLFNDMNVLFPKVL